MSRLEHRFCPETSPPILSKRGAIRAFPATAVAELSFTLKTNPLGSCSSVTLIRFNQKSSHRKGCKEGRFFLESMSLFLHSFHAALIFFV